MLERMYISFICVEKLMRCEIFEDVKSMRMRGQITCTHAHAQTHRQMSFSDYWHVLLHNTHGQSVPLEWMNECVLINYLLLFIMWFYASNEHVCPMHHGSTTNRNNWRHKTFDAHYSHYFVSSACRVFSKVNNIIFNSITCKKQKWVNEKEQVLFRSKAFQQKNILNLIVFSALCVLDN